MRKLVVLCSLIIALTSCNSKKIVSDVGGVKHLSTKKIIKYNKATLADYTSVSAKIKAKFKNHKTATSFTINLRMETDKVIWMSVKKFGFPVAKLKITPEKVLFYEKIKRGYFEGDFSLISDFLGTPLNFNQLQNLLVGKPIVTLKSNKLVTEVSKGDFVLSLKKQHHLYALFFNINTQDFTLKSQELRDLASTNTMRVTYSKFQHQIPEKIEIRVQAENKKTFVDLDFKSVQFDKTLSFPFSIPKGYKKISLKK